MLAMASDTALRPEPARLSEVAPLARTMDDLPAPGSPLMRFTVKIRCGVMAATLIDNYYQ
jgi:hypothetical protein